MTWIYTRDWIANDSQTADDFPNWKLDDFVQFCKNITSIMMDNMQLELEKLAVNTSNSSSITFKERYANWTRGRRVSTILNWNEDEEYLRFKKDIETEFKSFDCYRIVDTNWSATSIKDPIDQALFDKQNTFAMTVLRDKVHAPAAVRLFIDQDTLGRADLIWNNIVTSLSGSSLAASFAGDILIAIDVRDEEATFVSEAINEEIGTSTVPNKIEHDFVNGERNGDVVVDIINETKPFVAQTKAHDVIIDSLKDSLKDGEETTAFHSMNQTNNAETTTFQTNNVQLINQINNVGDSVGDTLGNNGDNVVDNENNCANSAIVFDNNNRTVDENNRASEDNENNHNTIAIVFIDQATPIDETIEIDENLPDFVNCGDCCDGDDSEINTAYNDDINNDNSGALDDVDGVEKQSDDNIVDVANGSNNSFVNTKMKSSDNNNDNDRDNGYRINIVTNNRDRLARMMNNTYDVTPHVVTPTPNSNNNVNCHVDSHDHDVDCHEDSYDHDTHDCMDDPIGNNRPSYCHFVSKKGDDDEHTVERLLINDDYLVSDDEFETPRQAYEQRSIGLSSYPS